MTRNWSFPDSKFGFLLDDLIEDDPLPGGDPDRITPERDNHTIDLEARLKSVVDPLQPELLEKLSIFFKVEGGNPDPLIKLYRECINALENLEKTWEPFIGTFSSTLSEGVLACKYFMVGYMEGLKVTREREVQDRQKADDDFDTRQEKIISKAFSDLLLMVKTNTLSVVPSAVSNENDNTKLSSLIVPASLNQFIWQNGKSYKSQIGILTANRDGSIAINLSSAEFQVINLLNSIILEPKHWEYILNRDLRELVSYLSLNLEIFIDFNRKDNPKKVNILNDLASQVSVNFNQWTDASEMIEGPRCILYCVLELDFGFKIDGPLPTTNVMELIETICVMVLLDWERPLKMSKSAIPFIWHFTCKHIFDHLKYDHRKRVLNKVSHQVKLNGLSEGLCQENAIGTQAVGGDRTWQITDNCDKYVTVEFTYQTGYSACQLSRKRMYRVEGFKIMKAPPADARARLLELETQLRNVKPVDQSEFLKPLLYLKREETTKVQGPTAS